MDLRAILDEVARQYADKAAIVSGSQRVSYSELDEVSNRVANALLGMGVSKGDRVAMLLSSSPEFVTIFFGIVKIGAIAVPFDTKCKFDEVATLLRHCQPKVLVSESLFLEPLIPALPGFESIEHVISLGAEYVGQFLSYDEIVAANPARRIGVEIEPGDIALISYASGPTSRPRGATLTHEALVAEAVASGDGFEQTCEDVVVLFALPLFHAFGLEIVLLTSLFRGSTVVLHSGLSIHSLMETIERERVTIFMGVPYIFTLAVNMAEREGVEHDLSSLRLCVSGGAPISLSVIERFKYYYGLDIVQVWGLTEATAHVTCQPVDGTGKPGGVGSALSGWEVKIVDDGGQEVPVNQPGEIIVRGPVMEYYYANPEDTAAVMKDGWLYTGDIGRIDEDGELFILGLKKDMIIVKGQNVYPMDIEAVLTAHPGVAEAAVVGIPDELRGERIRAVVSLKDGQSATEHELQELCRQHLANFKVPKQVVFVSSLPKDTDGRIRKEELKRI